MKTTHSTPKTGGHNNQNDFPAESANGKTTAVLNKQTNKPEINKGQDEQRGFEIAGLPWQFVLSFGMLGLLVVALALKLMGVI